MVQSGDILKRGGIVLIPLQSQVCTVDEVGAILIGSVGKVKVLCLISLILDIIQLDYIFLLD